MIPCGGEGGAEFRPLGGAGARDGIGEDHHRVVGERGHGVGDVAVFLESGDSAPQLQAAAVAADLTITFE